MKHKYILIAILSAIPKIIEAQSIISTFRSDSMGTLKRIKTMKIEGNKIATAISNNGKIGTDSQQSPFPSFLWPKENGVFYFTPISLFIGAEAKTNKGSIIHSIETNYLQQFMDTPGDFGLIPSSVSFEPLGLNAVPGYSVFNNSSFARSDDPSTWPSKWPVAVTGASSDLNGHWYGYFGRDVFNANVETFSVFDDSKDFEYTYPYPESRGYFYPIKNDEPANAYDADGLLHYYQPTIRKGLGLRIESRTFQWSQPKLENALFVMNFIYNISDQVYQNSCLGLFLNPHIGNDSDSGDDMVKWHASGRFIEFFDKDGKSPDFSGKIGSSAIVFLETPSNAENGVDDDGDGMIDERVDDGIDNDNDWVKFADLNGNNIWDWDPVTQLGEPINDDKGIDGVGVEDEPLDPVTGNKKNHIPDAGEGDGLPNNGEPNFDIRDIDEKDMLGINSAKSFGPSNILPKFDDAVFNFVFTKKIDLAVQNNNLNAIIASAGFSMGNNYFNGNFPIKFSYAIVFGQDSIELGENVKNAIKWYNSSYSLGEFNVGVSEQKYILPTNFSLSQNYPNPFNPETTISFDLPVNSEVEVSIFNLLGAKVGTVAQDLFPAGHHEVSFDASGLSSGVYFYQMKAGNFVQTRKLTVLK